MEPCIHVPCKEIDRKTVMKTWVSWIKPDKSAPIDINAINSNFDLQIFRQLIKAMPTIIPPYYNIRLSHAKLESVAQIH